MGDDPKPEKIELPSDGSLDALLDAAAAALVSDDPEMFGMVAKEVQRRTRKGTEHG